MKKSFLKRVMAAAVAVPVALSQTVMLASFAEDETTASTDSAVTVVNTDTFLNVKGLEADKIFDPSYDEYKALSKLGVDTADQHKYAFVQESNWNKVTQDALGALYGETFSVSPKKYAESIDSDAWYAAIVKDALNDSSAKVEATVYGDFVQIVISTNYNYSDTLTDLMKKEMPEEYKAYDFDLQVKATKNIAGKIVINVDTTKIESDKAISFNVADNTFFKMGDDPVDAAIKYVREVIAQAKQDVKDAAKVVYEDTLAEIETANKRLEDARTDLENAKGAPEDVIAEKQAELDAAQAEVDAAEKKSADAYALMNEKVDEIVGNYEAKLDKAVEKYNNFDGEGSRSYEAASVDEILQKAHDYAASKTHYGKKVPTSLDAIKKNSHYDDVKNLFADVVTEINNVAVQKGYKLDVTLDNVIEVAQREIDNYIAVTGSVAEDAKVVEGDVFALLVDKLTPEEEAEYTKVLNEKLATENKTVTQLYSAKAVQATGDADARTQTGNGTLNIYRVVWYDWEEVETTTTTEETTTTEVTTTTSEEVVETTTTSEEAVVTTTTTEESTTVATTEEPVETTTEPTTTETEPNTEGGRTDVVLAIRGAGSFYFSHDDRAFDVATLIDLENSVLLDKNGEPTDKKVDTSKFSFGLDKEGAIEGLSPEDVYNARVTGAAYQMTPVYVYYEGILVSMKDENGKDKYPEVYIGVKGDANLDGEAKADDAAEVLRYSANIGAGIEDYIKSEDNEILDNFAYFLADVNGESMDGGATAADGSAESKLDAVDAAYILAYSAGQGAGGIDWIGEEVGVFTEAPYPAISKAIYDAKKAG